MRGVRPSDLIKKEKRKYREKHTRGLTGSLTNKSGQLFGALPDNRAAAQLRSPRGQPGM